MCIANDKGQTATSSKYDPVLIVVIINVHVNKACYFRSPSRIEESKQDYVYCSYDLE